jgi:hypothetical protein
MQFADGETDVGLSNRRELALKLIAFGVVDRRAERQPRTAAMNRHNTTSI